MTIKTSTTRRERMLVLVVFLLIGIIASTRLQADTGTCSGASVTLPFTDVPAGNVFFCSIAAAYFSGLTNGTTPTTYSPSANIPREQMAAFVSRTLTQSLRRGSRRAALDQWATPTSIPFTAKTTVGDRPIRIKSDGADLWTVNGTGNSVSRVRASDGKLLDTWTGTMDPTRVLVARGRIFVAGGTLAGPGTLYVIDPKLAGGPAPILTNSLPVSPRGLAFDGFYIWVAGFQSICKVHPNTGVVTVFPTVYPTMQDMTFDGTHMWVTMETSIKKVDLNGNVVQTLAVPDAGSSLIFDGLNLWVMSSTSNAVTVVRVHDVAGNPVGSAFVLATLTGNGLDGPFDAAFDGERILVTNNFGDSVSLWKADDLTPLGSAGGANSPIGVCSDGLNFWICFATTPGEIARF